LGAKVKRNLDVNDVPPSFEDMTWEHPSHVALSTCDPPPLWGTLDLIGKGDISVCCTSMATFTTNTWTTKMALLLLDGSPRYISIGPHLFYGTFLKRGDAN